LNNQKEGSATAIALGKGEKRGKEDRNCCFRFDENLERTKTSLRLLLAGKGGGNGRKGEESTSTFRSFEKLGREKKETSGITLFLFDAKIPGREGKKGKEEEKRGGDLFYY